MKYKPQKIHLKNGKTVEIREGRISDAEDLIVSMKEILHDTEFLLVEEEELNMTVEEEIEWLKAIDAIPTSLFLVVTHENKILGNIGIHGNNFRKMKHTASLGISLAKEWQRLGLGYILMEEGLKWAKENTELKVIWLDVYSNNHALNLYRKLGFFEVGRIKNFVKLSSGYCDKIIMSLNLNNYISMR